MRLLDADLHERVPRRRRQIILWEPQRGEHRRHRDLRRRRRRRRGRRRRRAQPQDDVAGARPVPLHRELAHCGVATVMGLEGERRRRKGRRGGGELVGELGAERLEEASVEEERGAPPLEPPQRH